MELHSSPECIISCEHAGNQIPSGYESLFTAAEEILKSHRGWDLGALELAQEISNKTESQLFSYPYTRLFIESNRSIGHPKLFSEFTRHLPKTVKRSIIKNYYQPYRDEIFNAIKKNASEQIVTIHIGVHTFTPVFEGNQRDFEIGLLYDPKRKSEKKFCRLWKSNIMESFPDYQIRMNQPYKGAADGFTTYLRKNFSEKLYLGIELEVNQILCMRGLNDWKQIFSKIAESLPQILKGLPGNK